MARTVLPWLAWFQGGAFQNQILEFSQLSADAWSAIRAELEATALLGVQEIPGFTNPFLRFHPTLPYAARRDEVGDVAEAEERFVTVYLGVGREAGAALRPHLEADGITVRVGDRCVGVEPRGGAAPGRSAAVVLHLESGRTIAADRLLVATGRRPNVEAWRDAGLAETGKGWLRVDPATLEERPGVFAAGDVTGLGGFTHLAHYHGQIVARRILGGNDAGTVFDLPLPPMAAWRRNPALFGAAVQAYRVFDKYMN